MEIALYHKHFEEGHLEEVKKEMQKRGSPVIRAIWSQTYAMWMAIEGCHRIRAAKELGVNVTIKDITHNKTVTMQSDGEKVTVKIDRLTEQLNDDLWRTDYIVFDD